MTNEEAPARPREGDADTPAGRNGPASLSDRVQSLRLPDRPSGGRGRLPWVLCLLLLGSTVAFGYQAFRRPISEDASNKPAVDPAAGKQADSEGIALQAKGYIIPAHQIQVTPEVAGKIEWLHPDFEEGRRFEPWMVLARLKTVDYRADVARAKAA